MILVQFTLWTVPPTVWGQILRALQIHVLDSQPTLKAESISSLPEIPAQTLGYIFRHGKRSSNYQLQHLNFYKGSSPPIFLQSHLPRFCSFQSFPTSSCFPLHCCWRRRLLNLRTPQRAQKAFNNELVMDLSLVFLLSGIKEARHPGERLSRNSNGVPSWFSITKCRKEMK